MRRERARSADVQESRTGELPASAQLDEVLQRLAAVDGAKKAWPLGPTLDAIIAAQAQTRPYATAIVDRNVETSYRTLVTLAADMGQSLQMRRVGRGTRVGVCAEASSEFLASILAIWSVGATYVPLDPQLPKHRIDHIASDAAISLCITSSEHIDLVDRRKAVVFDDLKRSREAVFSSQAQPDDIACIVYTSGSTGLPKGVAVRHAGLRNAILASSEMRSYSPDDRDLFRTSIGFDVSLEELFCPLAAGGSIVVAPRGACGDPRALIALIVENKITSTFLSPSFLALLLEEAGFANCTSLRIVNCGGEALSVNLCARFLATSKASLFNSYGPSESSIVVTVHQCEPSDVLSGEQTVPIGIPLYNNHVSVRDAAMFPVEPGETGEIVIGGVQVAEGYVNRNLETAERFVSDPLRPDERVYRSGDIARLRADGSIIFLGRNDDQVKIRGVRVEPAEVAAAIERLNGVRTAVVVARHRKEASAADSPILAAYVAPLTGAVLDPSELRRALRAVLPVSMVPAEITFVDSFPLTVNGKIDESALMRGEAASLPSGNVESNRPFRGLLYEQIRFIWEDMLEIKGIGDNESFFDLGGDSLMALRLVVRLEETFGRRIPLLDFYDSMTIVGLGVLLSRDSDSSELERDAILLNGSGSMPPLVYLHGDLSGGMYCWSLARALGDHQPVLVVPPHGMRGRPAATNVEQMADDVVATITRYFPSGTLRIAGYSAAAYVAYESARILRSRGRDVLDAVVIGMGAENVAFTRLDTLAQRAHLPRKWRTRLIRGLRYRFRLQKYSGLSTRERRRRFAQFFGRSRSPDGKSGIESERRLYIRAHAAYVPRSYEGRLTVLWPDEQRVVYGNPQRDWSRVSSNLTITSVRGSHHEAVSRYITDVAKAMQDRFAQ